MPVPPLDVLIRPSTDADVAAMLAIYRYHVAHGVGDLGGYEDEDEPFEVEDMKRRRKTMKKRRLPHLVADVAGRVVGYAYAVPFRKRPAYRYTVKHSIYLHHDYVSCGIGRILLPALIDACAAAGYRQLIGYIDAANRASLRLHESLGFIQVGVLPSVGYKFGHWADSVMVQRALGPGDTTPPGVWPELAAADTPVLDPGGKEKA